MTPTTAKKLAIGLSLAAVTSLASCTSPSKLLSDGVDLPLPHGSLGDTPASNDGRSIIAKDARLVAKPTSRPGVVQSPYAPFSFVDVSGLDASETVARDTASGKVFIIPR